jgi:outer membrane protein TolC
MAAFATGIFLSASAVRPPRASAQTATADGHDSKGAIPGGQPLSVLEAVRTTLRLHPAIQTAEAMLEQSRALLKVAQGPFDPLVTASVSQTHAASPVLPAAALATGEQSLMTDTTALNLGASVNTTWGTSITPSVGLSRVNQRANIPITSAGFMTVPGQYALVGVNVTQPLLRGAGTVGAASAIAAAKLARDAAAHTVDGTAQAQVYLTLVAYFQLVAATENLALLRDAETAARKVVEDTKVLVEAQQRPRSDLPSLEGNLANRSQAAIDAEDDRIQAVQSLALAMGRGLEGALDWRSTDDFPDPSTPTPDRDTIVRSALRDRKDLAAARETVASATALLEGAQHNTLPSVDLNVSLGYAGALQSDGVGPFFEALGNNVPGVNGSVGLSLALPVNNTAQQADRDLKRSQQEQAAVAQRDLERQVPITAASALRDLALSRDALAAAVNAVKQFAQAVTDQRDNLHEGAGTVIDLVLTEELLITAEQSRTANQLRCASALARVLYEMGALPSADGPPIAALGRLLGMTEGRSP